MKTYKEIITHENKEIQISLWFRKNSEYGSGYVATVIPIKRTHTPGYTLTESGCFTGFNKLLLPKERQHAAYFKQALNILNKEKEDLIQHLLKISNNE